MSILNRHLAFVKAHVAVQQKLVKKFAPDSKQHNPSRYQLHLANVERFSELFDDLQRADSELDQLSAQVRKIPRGPIQLQLMPSELEDLPVELLEQLSAQSADPLEMAIYAIFNEAPAGILSLDRVLIHLYRRIGEVHKRATITAKLYRMVGKGILFNVPGRKGWYSLTELADEEANELFGGPPNNSEKEKPL
jgi:hypothetical protein